MKIFYDILEVGNCHIRGDRIVARELKAKNLEVTHHFTVKSQDRFYDMKFFNG